MSMHPARTDRGTMKIRRRADSLVIERSCPDAQEIVTRDPTGFELAEPGTPSIGELLNATSAGVLAALCAEIGHAAHPADTAAHLAGVLVPAFEDGRLTLAALA